MKTKPTPQPSNQPVRYHFNVLGQLLKYILRFIVNEAAGRHGIEAKARSFRVWSHLATMIFVQLAHALSLNPGFGAKRKGHRLLHRFMVRVHAAD